MAAAGLAAFVLLTVLVQLRLLVGLDRAVALWAASLPPQSLLAVSTVLSMAFSAELSLLSALLVSFVLWRRGLGLWSLAPLAFLLLILIEIALKLTIGQPPVSAELHRSSYYPLATLRLPGSFPSGHALRSGFVCAFAGMLLSAEGGRLGWIGPAASAVVAGLSGFTRVYLGDHWITDVAAGMVLGASVALLLGLAISRRASATPS